MWFVRWSPELSLFEQFRGGTTAVVGLIASALIWLGYPQARRVSSLGRLLRQLLSVPIPFADDGLASAVSSVLLLGLLLILIRQVLRVLPPPLGAKTRGLTLLRLLVYSALHS
jgi:hypothetical protein